VRRALSSIQVGDEFTLERTADPYRALYYAAASGDFNPIHLDAEVGKKAGLGGPILHGMATMAWMVEAAVVFLGDPTLITKVRTRFSRPVALGDVVRFTGRVTKIDGGLLSAEISAVNQRGEDVLRNGTVEARIG
jgi:3-hydroxybutyryl-CoA dehydratase